MDRRGPALKSSVSEMVAESRELTERLFGKELVFYRPDFLGSSKGSFPTFSVTGASCALQCEHCKAEVLRSMKPAQTPETLLEDMLSAHARGARGSLVSGGSRPDGSVPLEPFVDAIASAKRETGMTVVVHTGLIRRETASKLARAGVDAALIDLLGDEHSIRDVYHLDARVGDYRRAVADLVDAGIPLTPHYIVGLGVRPSTIETVLDMLDDHRPKAFIVIALRPLQGTPIAQTPPPTPEDVAYAVARARLRLKDVPLALGCMRPVGRLREEIDRMAIGAGINALAHPTRGAYAAAEGGGWKVTERFTCCSEVFVDYPNQPA
jgi:uncharacterized radical SAM superfamily protein